MSPCSFPLVASGGKRTSSRKARGQAGPRPEKVVVPRTLSLFYFQHRGHSPPWLRPLPRRRAPALTHAPEVRLRRPAPHALTVASLPFPFGGPRCPPCLPSPPQPWARIPLGRSARATQGPGEGSRSSWRPFGPPFPPWRQVWAFFASTSGFFGHRTYNVPCPCQ